MRNATVLALAALFLTPGCILVVEEDDYGYGGHHGLYGTSWTLEIWFFRGRSYDMHDRGYGVHFRDTDALSGSTDCGAFDASYSVDSDRLIVNRVRAQSFGCSAETVSDLFLQELGGEFTFRVDGDELLVEGSRGTELIFRR